MCSLLCYEPYKTWRDFIFQANDVNTVGAPSKNCRLRLAISKSNPEEFMISTDKYYDITSLPVIHFDNVPTKCKNEIRIEHTADGTITINHEKGKISKYVGTEKVYCVFELGRIQLRSAHKERQNIEDTVSPISEIKHTPINQSDVPDSVYIKSKRELDKIRQDAEEILIYSNAYNPAFKSRNIEIETSDTENESTCESKFTITETGEDNNFIHDKMEGISTRLVLVEETVNSLNVGKELYIQSSEMQVLRSEIKVINTLLTRHSYNTGDGESHVANHRKLTSLNENSKPLHERIRENFQMLVSMLEINPVLDYLYQAGNITMEDFQRLRKLSKSNMAEANRELLYTILRRQNLDTEFLEDILIKSKQDGILAVMFPHQSYRKEHVNKRFRDGLVDKETHILRNSKKDNMEEHVKKGLMDGPSDKEMHRLKNSKMDNFKEHVKTWFIDDLIDKEI